MKMERFTAVFHLGQPEAETVLALFTLELRVDSARQNPNRGYYSEIYNLVTWIKPMAFTGGGVMI